MNRRSLAVIALAALGTAGCSGDASFSGESTESALNPGDVSADAVAHVSVLTHHNDNARTGANLAETVLTPARVKQGFGMLFELPVDDQIYAQPLYAASVAIPGKGTRDVLYVATVNNSLYAFDAVAGGAPLWHRSLNGTGRAAARNDLNASCACTSGKMGIMGTPVIDPAAGTLYVVARTIEGSSAVQRLHAVSITTGADRAGSPVMIQASVPGTGDGSDGHGHVVFDAKMHNQRPALLLSGGSLTVAWSSQCDKRPYHGWVMAFDASTLRQTGVWNDTPNGSQGGIWQSGGGTIADGKGFVYVGTGNGTWDGKTDFGESLVKLHASTLALADWFTPSDFANMNQTDSDFASSGTILIPGTTHLATGTKTGHLFVTDSASLGHMVKGDTQIPQSLVVDLTKSGTNHVHGGPVYWKSAAGAFLYVWPENDFLRAYPVNSGKLAANASSHSPEKPSPGMPGGILSLSANGTTGGIVWATHPTDGDAVHATRHGALRAYDATNVSTELWNSEAKAADDLGEFAKFTPPTVANGRVYVATFSNRVDVYGPK
jgi:hypothetical protein